MATVTLDAFFPEVMPYLYGCPDVVAEHAIRQAAIDFCVRTDWLQSELAPITTVVGTADYTPAMPTDTALARVLQAWCDEIPLQQVAIEQLLGRFGMDWRDLAAGPPMYITTLQTSAVSLCPSPAAAGALKLVVSLKPTRTAAVLDQQLYDSWAPEIGLGARARLQGMAGQPFFDPKAAQMLARQFGSGMDRAYIDRNQARMGGGGMVEFPRTWC